MESGTRMADRKLPADPLRFIRDCVRNRRVLWTYKACSVLQDDKPGTDRLAETGTAGGAQGQARWNDDRWPPSHTDPSGSGV